MCRHLAYVGEPVALAELLYDPPHALCRQAWEPRFLDVGALNADGWGVGWYGADPEPARYRTSTPMWADQGFAGIARHIRAGHVVAAVRNATLGFPVEDSGAAPFAAGRWLFSHNGLVDRWNDGLGRRCRRALSDRREAGLVGHSDSEVIFAMVLDRLDAGAPAADALPAVVAELREQSGGRFNLLLSDGDDVVATRDGCSLFVRDGADAVIVASEPLDDGGGWHPVPDRSLVTVTAGSVTIRPL